jgi:hypothetical protein
MSETIVKVCEVKDVEFGSREPHLNGDKILFDGYDVVTTKQTIRLLICADQDCCESWGYFWCNDNPQEFVGAEVSGVTVTDTALNTTKLADVSDLDAGGVMFVNIDTDRGVLQFVAYNAQNGYYGHQAIVESVQLKHETVL